MKRLFTFAFAHAGIAILFLGLFQLGFGAIVLYSAAPQAGTDTAVLKQQISDYIGQTDKRLDESGVRLASLEAKVSKIDTDTSAIRAIQRMSLAQQDKIIYALWVMISGILGLFAERVFAVVLSKKKG